MKEDKRGKETKGKSKRQAKSQTSRNAGNVSLPQDPIHYPQADSLYYHIAKDALEAAKNENYNFEKAQKVVTAVVFFALCMEAFINQEYAGHPETSKIIENGDRIPLLTKWLLLPLLLGAEHTFDKGKTPFQTFKELVQIRNTRLVHFKLEREAYSKQEAESNKLTFYKLVTDVERAEKYKMCILEMINKLKEITHDRTRRPDFAFELKYLEETREDLHGDLRLKAGDEEA